MKFTKTAIVQLAFLVLPEAMALRGSRRNFRSSRSVLPSSMLKRQSQKPQNMDFMRMLTEDEVEQVAKAIIPELDQEEALETFRGLGKDKQNEVAKIVGEYLNGSLLEEDVYMELGEIVPEAVGILKKIKVDGMAEKVANKIIPGQDRKAALNEFHSLDGEKQEKIGNLVGKYMSGAMSEDELFKELENVYPEGKGLLNKIKEDAASAIEVEAV